MNLHDPGRGEGLPAAQPEHGQAALLITESLLHVLVERSILSVEDVVSALQTAIEVKADLSSSGEPKGPANASLDLIFRILDSIVTDLPDERVGPETPSESGNKC